jgi:hypothetical protein
LQKKSDVTLALSRCHDRKLVGLILFLGFRKGRYCPRCLEFVLD